MSIIQHSAENPSLTNTMILRDKQDRLVLAAGQSALDRIAGREPKMTVRSYPKDSGHRFIVTRDDAGVHVIDSAHEHTEHVTLTDAEIITDCGDYLLIEGRDAQTNADVRLLVCHDETALNRLLSKVVLS